MFTNEKCLQMIAETLWGKKYLASMESCINMRILQNLCYHFSHTQLCEALNVIYRVIQEESALLWEVIVRVILSKKVHTNMGPILNGYGVMGIF
jgi:hypothetical protein